MRLQVDEYPETRTREGIADQQAFHPSSSLVTLRSMPEAQLREAHPYLCPGPVEQKLPESQSLRFNPCSGHLAGSVCAPKMTESTTNAPMGRRGLKEKVQAALSKPDELR